MSKLRNSSWVRLVGMLVLQVQRSFPFHRVLRMLTALPALSLRMRVGSTEFYNAQPTNQGKMSTGTSKNMYIHSIIRATGKIACLGKMPWANRFCRFWIWIVGYRFWGVPYQCPKPLRSSFGNFLLALFLHFFWQLIYLSNFVTKKNATLWGETNT